MTSQLTEILPTWDRNHILCQGCQVLARSRPPSVTSYHRSVARDFWQFLEEAKGFWSCFFCLVYCSSSSFHSWLPPSSLFSWNATCSERACLTNLSLSFQSACIALFYFLHVFHRFLNYLQWICITFIFGEKSTLFKNTSAFGFF